MEAATAHWFPVEMTKPLAQHSKITTGRERLFESVENAVLFIMETLPEGDRSNATIMTDSITINLADIEKMYLKTKKPRHPEG